MSTRFCGIGGASPGANPGLDFRTKMGPGLGQLAHPSVGNHRRPLHHHHVYVGLEPRWPLGL